MCDDVSYPQWNFGIANPFYIVPFVEKEQICDPVGILKGGDIAGSIIDVT